MNALFYISRLEYNDLGPGAFLVTTPDGPHDRHAAVLDTFHAEFRREFGHPAPTTIRAEFVCLTHESVWKEV